MAAVKQVLAAADSLEIVGRVEELLLETTAATMERVRDGVSALALASDRRFSLIVTEFPLPDLDMREFLDGLREPASISKDSPVVVLAGSVDRLQLEELGPERLTGVEFCTSSSQTLRAVTQKLQLGDRLPASLRVRVSAATESFSGTQLTRTRNISPSGMLLGAEHLLPVGMVTPIAIELSDDEPLIHGHAEVVRHCDPEREEVVGMGMRFVRLFGDGGERLESFVHSELDLARGPLRYSA